MFRLHISLPLVLVLAQMLGTSVARGESEPALWRFAPPNSQTVIGIDWARIRQSQAGVIIQDKWLPRGAMAGFPIQELLSSVDRFLISAPGRAALADGAEPDAEGDSGETTLLIAIQGHFDAARVRQMFQQSGAKPQAYESFQVYRPQSKRNQSKPTHDLAWVLVDSETVLYGDAPLVFAALDRNRFAQAPAQSLAAGSMVGRAVALEAKYEVWAIMQTNQVMSNDPIADLFGASEWAASEQGFEAGMNLGAGLDADFFVQFSSDVAAKRVVADLNRAVAMAAKDKNMDAETQNIARKLKFNVDGSSAKISLRLNNQELAKAAEAFGGVLKGGDRLATTTTSTPNPVSAPAAAPSQPAVIRIEGLDDGPREIPYHP